MELNLPIILASALIPLVVGFIWYHPALFGNTWMKAAGLTPDSVKGGNMALIFGLTFLFSFFLAFAVQFIVIHQWHIYSLLAEEPGLDDPTTLAGGLLKTILDNYGSHFRTFGHGSFHGVLAGITTALPILAINALFERKGFKYVALNAGYWIVTLALMGGVLCAFS